jgi:hypothetical protein
MPAVRPSVRLGVDDDDDGDASLNFVHACLRQGPSFRRASVQRLVSSRVVCISVCRR